jgi:hypothetical protein
MSLRVNLSSVEGDVFDPIKAGNYPLDVFDGEIREGGPDAKHPGAEYIAWEFTVAAGDNEGRHLWDNTVFRHDYTDEDGNFIGCDCGDEEAIEKYYKGLFKLKNLLSATGKWTAEELDSDEFSFTIEDVLGSRVKARVTVRKSDEYGDSNVIKSYKPLDAAEVGSSSVLP